MTKDQYNILKDNREELILEIAIRSFDNKELITDEDIENRYWIIEKYFNMNKPIDLLGQGRYFLEQTKRKRKDLLKWLSNK